MNNLPVLADRLAKLFLIYSLFIAAIVIGIPSAIVLFHSDSADPGKNIVDTSLEKNVANPAKSESTAKRTTKSSPTPAPLHTLSFGWVTGNYSNLANYNNLQIVSPLFASIGASSPLKVETASPLISKMHGEGKKVWGRVTMEAQTSAATRQFLENPGRINQTAQEIGSNAVKSRMDGINVDIENIGANDRKAFMSFIVALSNALKPNHILLSVDLQPETGGVQNISSFNQVLNQYSDYVVFMGYDEHWATDPTPGPVTSLQWLKNNVQQFIKTGISAQKLLLGLPSYTRVWQVDANGATIQSQAVSSEDFNNLMLKEHHSGQWNSTTGTSYVSYSVGGKQYKAWLMNDQSLQSYLQLIQDYHLAGYGFWNLNLMSANNWNKLPNPG
ncbi:glycosyl hydrolase family 18 protein [Sporolactobacillus sp. KGMB 08714]|uniref:glycosyl hydrolase family 18 protein n=1 Tax=Sporolactobacillus sp. KGMB 08714 TaxID=3064704 RepID=UPI002FBEE1DC